MKNAQTSLGPRTIGCSSSNAPVVGGNPEWTTHHTEMLFKRGRTVCTPLELWEINIFSRGQKLHNLEIRQIVQFQPRYTSSNMYFLCRGAKVAIVFLRIINLALFETFIVV